MSADPELHPPHQWKSRGEKEAYYAIIYGVGPANFSFADTESAPEPSAECRSCGGTSNLHAPDCQEMAHGGSDSLHGVTSTPLPCPFCGEAPITHEIQLEIYCGCGASMIGLTPEEAIARWNRRAPPPPTEEQLLALVNEVTRIMGEIERENEQANKEQMLRKIYELFPPKKRET